VNRCERSCAGITEIQADHFERINRQTLLAVKMTLPIYRAHWLLSGLANLICDRTSSNWPSVILAGLVLPKCWKRSLNAVVSAISTTWRKQQHSARPMPLDRRPGRSAKCPAQAERIRLMGPGMPSLEQQRT